MALIKNETTEFGIEAGYWKVGMVSIDRNMKEGSYSLMLYMDKEAISFLDTRVISLNELEDKSRYYSVFETDESVIHRCYEDAKLHDGYFADAENDEEYTNEIRN